MMNLADLALLVLGEDGVRVAPPGLEVPGDGLLMMVDRRWVIFLKPDIQPARQARVLAILLAEHWIVKPGRCDASPADIDLAVRALAESLLANAGVRPAILRPATSSRAAG